MEERRKRVALRDMKKNLFGRKSLPSSTSASAEVSRRCSSELEQTETSSSRKRPRRSSVETQLKELDDDSVLRRKTSEDRPEIDENHTVSGEKTFEKGRTWRKASNLDSAEENAEKTMNLVTRVGTRRSSRLARTGPSLSSDVGNTWGKEDADLGKDVRLKDKTSKDSEKKHPVETIAHSIVDLKAKVAQLEASITDSSPSSSRPKRSVTKQLSTRKSKTKPAPIRKKSVDDAPVSEFPGVPNRIRRATRLSHSYNEADQDAAFDAMLNP